MLPSAFLGDTHATGRMVWMLWLTHLLSAEEKWDDNNPFWCIGKGHELTNSVIHDPWVRREWQMIDNIFPHCFWQVACGRRDQSQLLKRIEISAQGKEAAANTWIMLHSAWDCLSSSYISLWAFYSKCSIFQSIQHPLLFPDAPVCSGYWISYWNGPSEDHAFFSRDFQ